MKTKSIIKKAALISISALTVLLSLSSCSADTDKTPQDTGKKEKILTHQGQNLTDKVSSLKFGDKEFKLQCNSEEFQNIFGEQSTIWYSKEILDEFNKENGENEKFQNTVSTYIVQDGVFCGDVTFYQSDNSKIDVILHLGTAYDFGDKEKFDIAQDISYTENGKVKKKDFPFETDKIRFSIGQFTTGTATREQLEQYLGKGKYAELQNYSREAFAFEDFTVVTYFDPDDIFKGVYIFRTDYDDYFDDIFDKMSENISNKP